MSDRGMTKKEAISLLTQVNKILVNSNSWLENTHEPLNMAFDMAIKALEQEPCGDTISRKMTIDTLHDNAPDQEGVDDLIAIIKEIPSVKPQEPKTGHWIRQDNTKKPLYGWYFCSECNSVIGDKTKFCSNCGAKMEDKE